ncbi:MAG: hypothetical protein KME56_02035 [Candidatus Thiodiazotropha sp. (ex Ctena orbiculata)]|nr:hypothetical protein [Candidatus Thiodiazotropha taylori]MBT2995402.1 hypothetical protein [Candidatus Thiodiazotropha taylori]MBT3001862.1 hypothetical protein [Candidatus Thiodiazotropha taylori]MBV2109313.1 hypothetical protein [Candidatus Thiodiazotropha taylori]MBV2109366.1 hypothetical protein [Candidatus Thiodiazotropha taylori]
MLVLSAVLFVLYASYPGYLNPDSTNQLTQIYTGRYSDWHAPFSTLVWSLIHALIPGPFGFVVLVNLLIWGSLAALTFAYSRRLGALSIAFLVVPLLPGAFNMLGNVHKDVLLVGWLLAAAVFGYLANRDGATRAHKVIFLVVANLLLLAGFLTRLNTVFAIIPLLLYINHGLGWRRNMLVAAVVLLSMPMLHTSLLTMTRADRSHPGDSIKTYQLLGLSYMEGRNLFPGEWSDDQARRIVESCYTPIQWDTAALWGKCGFIHKELMRQKLWGSDRLTRAWISEALNNPLGLFTVIAASFHKSISDPNSRSMFYRPGESKLFHWEVETDPPRLATTLAQGYVTSPVNDLLGRPLLFAVLAMIGLSLLIVSRAEINADGLFAMALMCSGLVNILSYFLVTVSAEYRYFYWSGFSIYLGMVITVFSLAFTNRRGRVCSIGNWTVRAVVVLLGTGVGLVTTADPLPPIERQLSLTPMDERRVVLKGLHSASKPGWMGLNVDGELSPHGWQTDEHGRLSGNSSSGVLMARLATHGLAVEVVLTTGRERGRVLIESDGYRELVELSSAGEGERVVTIRPTAAQRIKKNHALWSSPLKALGYCLLTILFLHWLAARYRPEPMPAAG